MQIFEYHNWVYGPKWLWSKFSTGTIYRSGEPTELGAKLLITIFGFGLCVVETDDAGQIVFDQKHERAVRRVLFGRFKFVPNVAVAS